MLRMGASSVQARQLWDLVEEGGPLTSPLERKAVGREETRLFAPLLVFFQWDGLVLSRFFLPNSLYSLCIKHLILQRVGSDSQQKPSLQLVSNEAAN